MRRGRWCSCRWVRAGCCWIGRLFEQQPLALRRRILRKAFAVLASSTVDLSFEAVEGALAVVEKAHTGARASLPGGVSLMADYETLILSSAPQDVATELPQLATPTPQTLPVPGRVLLGNGWVLTADLVEATVQTAKSNRDPWQAYLQLDAPCQLVVRGRTVGSGCSRWAWTAVRPACRMSLSIAKCRAGCVRAGRWSARHIT